MNHKHLFGERPLHGVVAAILIAFAIIGYGAWCAHTLTQSAAGAFAAGFRVVRAVPAPTLAAPAAAQVAVRAAKADKGVFFDAEAAGDIADQSVPAEDGNDGSSKEHLLAQLK
jgi:hypothetical protein